MDLWCVDHEKNRDASSAKAEIIFQGDSLCLICFDKRGG